MAQSPSDEDRPLVLSLLITGIAATAEAAGASRLAAGTLVLAVIVRTLGYDSGMSRAGCR